MKNIIIGMILLTISLSQNSEIKTVLDNYTNAYSSKNDQSYKSLFIDENESLRYISNRGNQSRTILAKEVMPMLKSRDRNYIKSLSNIEISVFGKIAIARYNWDLNGRMSGYEIMSLIKEDGKWLISDITYSVTKMGGGGRHRGAAH